MAFGIAAAPLRQSAISSAVAPIFFLADNGAKPRQRRAFRED